MASVNILRRSHMLEKLIQHEEKLNKFDKQRKLWLMASAFVVIAVLGIIFDWNQIRENRLIWVASSTGLTITVIWWYWTMKLLRELIAHRRAESQLLREIVSDFKSVIREIIDFSNRKD
jgi:hypothetical protein